MKINNNIVDVLTRVAVANDYPRAKMSAGLVKSNRLISIGTNRMKSDPLQAKYGKNREAIYLHAEIHAIKNALKEYSLDEIEGSDLYVVRVKRKDEHSIGFIHGMAKPCEGCVRAINEFGIRNVAFTNGIGMACYETD